MGASKRSERKKTVWRGGIEDKVSCCPQTPAGSPSSNWAWPRSDTMQLDHSFPRKWLPDGMKEGKLKKGPAKHRLAVEWEGEQEAGNGAMVAFRKGGKETVRRRK